MKKRIEIIIDLTACEENIWEQIYESHVKIAKIKKPWYKRLLSWF